MSSFVPDSEVVWYYLLWYDWEPDTAKQDPNEAPFDLSVPYPYQSVSPRVLLIRNADARGQKVHAGPILSLSPLM